jgi:hypothetical protein
MTELFSYTVEKNEVKVFHKKEENDWQVFHLLNTKNNTTAELWVEKEFDYFEWQNWEDGFWTKEQEYYQFSSGVYLTESYGQDMMEYLQNEFEDLFPYFH